MRRLMRALRFLLFVLLGLVVLGAVAGVAAFQVAKSVYEADMPSNEQIRALPLQVPLRVFTKEGRMIGEFGAERRAPLAFAQFPDRLVQAFLAAEDDRFFEHPGVDWQGLLRAAFKLVQTGEKTQGGSTITMQLARNYFLGNERSYERKVKEILLALRMEEELGKEQILETYLNKIFLGQRAYGVGAAAQVYFGKTVEQLTLSEVAILAGLPKAPSRDNPVDHPERARDRRDYVLRRMRELDYISAEQHEVALSEPVHAELRVPEVETEAHYVAEMVRAELFARYGEAAYTGGYRVITTIDSTRQVAANAALREALLDYEQRQTFRGAPARLDEAIAAPLATDPGAVREQVLAALRAQNRVPELMTAAVLAHDAKALKVLCLDGMERTLEGKAIQWANFGANNRLKPGDVVYLRTLAPPAAAPAAATATATAATAADAPAAPPAVQWQLTQLPQVQGAFVAIDPRDGAIQALVGGYDFFAGKFNRVTQARRQPGSGFKPFLYAAALAAGFTPASVVLDAPVVYDDPSLEDEWRPKNFTGKFYGPTRLREALVHSRNLVTIRLLQAVGVDYARTYMALFGLDPTRMHANLALALGTPDYTPLEIARAYSVFANDGFRIEPYFIREVVDGNNNVVFSADPVVACSSCVEVQHVVATLGPPGAVDAEAPGEAGGPRADTAAGGGPGNGVPDDGTPDLPGGAPGALPPLPPAPPPGTLTPDGHKLAPRVVDPRVTYLVNDILREVTVRGTAAAARSLGRNDIAGKTGTTNDETDAWFSGYSPTLVGVAWVGFDQPQPLGRGEVGGRAALPMWMDFMRVALKDVPEESHPRPPGLVNVRIDGGSGALAAADDPGAIFELVQSELVPFLGSTITEGPDGPPPTSAPGDDLY